MVRRSAPFLATFLALVLVLLAAAPAAAYNHENQYHLRLHRLDPLACGTPIGIQAKLTDKHGHRISGATIHFSIVKGKPGDVLSPTSAVTNSQGKAVTHVTLACTSGTHLTRILATGPGDAKAHITLVLHRHHDEDQDDNDLHHRDRSDTALLLASTNGSNGPGAVVVTAVSRSVAASPVAATSPASAPQAPLAPIGAILLGTMTVLVAAAWRRRARRPTAG
jgi:hypothetical protein